MKCRAIFIVLMLFVVCGTNFAGIRSPGKYSGVVVFDRWDGCTLFSGIYVMYVSEKVKEQLRPYAGKAVQINATDVYQPMNPGDGLIKAFEYIGPAGGKQPYGVELEALELKSMIACADGEKPAVEMEIVNHGKDAVKIDSRELALTLLMNQDDRTKGLSPSDGPSAALVTRQNFWALIEGQSRWQGRGVRHGTEYRWSIGQENALPRVFELEAGEKRRVKITFDLGEGEYEFLCGYGGGVHEGKCLASNLVAFDVDAKGLAKNVPAKKHTSVEDCAEPVVGHFESFAVRIDNMMYRDSLIIINRNGKYSYKLTSSMGKPESITLEYRLLPEHITELDQLLAGTGWLSAPVPEESRIEDGTEYIMTLNKAGKKKTIKCHQGEGDKSYVPLFRFIQRIARQEWLYYSAVHSPEGFGDFLQDMKQEVGMLTGKSYFVYAPMLDYARILPTFRRTLAEPWGRSDDEVVIAIDLFGYLKDDSEFDHIAALSNDRDSHVRRAVANAMCRFGGKRSVELLRGMLKSSGGDAAWALIRLGDIAVGVLAEEIRKGVDVHDNTSVSIIRAYIDHWDQVQKPLDKRITDAVYESLKGRLKSSSAQKQFHEELLKLADVKLPAEK